MHFLLETRSTLADNYTRQQRHNLNRKTPQMTAYYPKNTQVFELTAQDFLTASKDSWQFERLMADAGIDADLPEDERAEALEDAANELAGFYWWTCCAGCLPDSDAFGPFSDEQEAWEDAEAEFSDGSEDDEKRFALAKELDCAPSELSEERYDHYGLTVFSYAGEEYAVGTDCEADEAWDRALDSYIDDCLLPEIKDETLRNYFDANAWKRDARFDGRGHSLSSYDGCEIGLDGGFVAFRIN